MSGGRRGVGLREQDWRNVSRMRTEKFAFAAYVLNIIGLLQYGGLLLDPRGRVLSLNPIAAHSLGDGLTLRRNRLVATERESNSRLQSSIEQALNLTGSSDAPATWLELHRAAGTPLLLRLLWLQESIRPALNGASLLLVTFDPEIRQAPPADMLGRMFALTRAEAEVAIGIGSGKRVAEIAANRAVKVETVRTHSKTVFAKTRTRGQAELAALLARLAVVNPGHEAEVAQADALTNRSFFARGFESR